MNEFTKDNFLDIVANEKVLQDLGFKNVEEADLMIENIGDGNLNVVLKVYVRSQENKAVVVKHAPPYVKCIGPEYPLTTSRMDIESKSLAKYQEICPGSVPHLYCYSAKHNTVVMEHLGGYTVMRKQLIDGTVDKVAAQKLAETLGKVHSATHVSNLSAEDWQSLKLQFRNPDMVDLTYKFIFTNPYIKDHPTNKVHPHLTQAAERVYTDQSVLSAVAALRDKFTGSDQCLVHGDLHTGSVMTKQGQPKVLDGEFSYVGPPAFDVGLLVAHYLITYHRHMLTEENNPLHRQVAYKAMDACKIIAESYLEHFTPQVADSDQFTQDLMSDVAGFAGCELVRRVLGIAHVEDISHSGPMELEVLQCGLRLLRSHHRIHSMDRLLFIGLQLC